MKFAVVITFVLIPLVVPTSASSEAESVAATAASSCAPPALGFGTGEGWNAPELPPTVGDLRIAMLFVDFADSPGSTTPQSIYDTYVPRVVDWYRTVSYGRLHITVTPYPRWIRLPRTLAEYEAQNFEGAVQAAVLATDENFDFGPFRAMYVVPSMPSLASTIVDDVPIRVDGATLHSWAWLATGSLQRLPFVAIHETGHLLGLPDLYGGFTSNQSRWDVMSAAARGGGMFAWHRWKLGWLGVEQIVCVTRRARAEVVLTPLERAGGRKAIVSRVGRAAVVVEVRRPIAEDGSLCLAGVLVYRVDFVTGSPDNAGSRLRPIQVYQARRDDPRRTARCGAEWRAPLGLGRGRVTHATTWNHAILVLRRLQDGSYRVRLARR
jgi:M6 family metalloprotease-like protein